MQWMFETKLIDIFMQKPFQNNISIVSFLAPPFSCANKVCKVIVKVFKSAEAMHAYKHGHLWKFAATCTDKSNMPRSSFTMHLFWYGLTQNGILA